MQRYYELMMVITPQADEEGLAASLERVNRYIAQRGGTVIRQQRWGNVRRLAYPIKNHREGSYVLTHLQMEPRDAGELEADIKVSEDILRHLMVKVEKIPEPIAERPQPAPVAEERAIAPEDEPLLAAEEQLTAVEEEGTEGTVTQGELAPAIEEEAVPTVGEVVPKEPDADPSGEETTEREEPGQ